LKIGYFAPLPPARTGVADYAAALLDALRRHGDVEVEAARADVNLYHLGNNQIHRDIYRRALREPGVVVLHDAVLQHFFLGWLDEQAYADEFVYNYGEWSRSLGVQLWRRRAASLSARYFEYAMLRRIAERSRVVVVHNAGAAAMVRRHAPAARIVEIPLLCRRQPLPGAAEALRFRLDLGIPSGAFVFAVLGYLRESKRVLAVLNAFERVQDKARLLIAGEFISSDLERAAGPLMRHPAIVRLPYLPASKFWLAARACDACINLRYPAAGETSDITIQMMGAAKPVLVTAGPENSGFPDHVCLRVEPGVGERDSLFEHMVLLTSFTGVAREIGANAAAYVAEEHAVNRVGEHYWTALCAARL
jgi:glycosyltransferase involved in cell wall biosynthesis